MALRSTSPSSPEGGRAAGRPSVTRDDPSTPISLSCREIANEVGASVPDQCFKIKWDITLFQDEVTGAPTTYRIDGTLYRQSPRVGKWKIVSASTQPANAIIYELEAASGHGSIRLLKADDNIMFFIGQDGRLMVGNADFSYTLN